MGKNYIPTSRSCSSACCHKALAQRRRLSRSQFRATKTCLTNLGGTKEKGRNKNIKKKHAWSLHRFAMNDFLWLLRFFCWDHHPYYTRHLTSFWQAAFGALCAPCFAPKNSAFLAVSRRHSDAPTLPIASLCLPLALQAIPLLHQLLQWKRWIPTRHETMASVRVGIGTYDVWWKTIGILWTFLSKKPWLRFQESSPTVLVASLLNLTI